MSVSLDRAGIFRARPIEWGWRRFDTSKSVKIWIKFVITEYLIPGDNVWEDWSQYEEMHVSGDYFVVKKDGTVNSKTVDQLVQSMRWGGTFAELSGPPPECVVQINVSQEAYEGKTVFRAGWMNPGDFVPQSKDPAEAKSLDAEYGSLMRAAASTAPKPAGKPPPPAKPKPRPNPREGLAPVEDEAPLELDGGDTPF